MLEPQRERSPADLAPLSHMSTAVSFPMPVLQPVMSTVLPSILALLLHRPPLKKRRTTYRTTTETKSFRNMLAAI